MWEGNFSTIPAKEYFKDVGKGTHLIPLMPYRQGPAMRERVATEVRKLLHAGINEPDTSEWASTVVLVPENDGIRRLCVDYRSLNTKTLSNDYPLLSMDD